MKNKKINFDCAFNGSLSLPPTTTLAAATLYPTWFCPSPPKKTPLLSLRKTVSTIFPIQFS